MKTGLPHVKPRLLYFVLRRFALDFRWGYSSATPSRPGVQRYAAVAAVERHTRDRGCFRARPAPDAIDFRNTSSPTQPARLRGPQPRCKKPTERILAPSPRSRASPVGVGRFKVGAHPLYAHFSHYIPDPVLHNHPSGHHQSWYSVHPDPCARTTHHGTILNPRSGVGVPAQSATPPKPPHKI